MNTHYQRSCIFQLVARLPTVPRNWVQIFTLILCKCQIWQCGFFKWFIGCYVDSSSKYHIVCTCTWQLIIMTKDKSELFLMIGSHSCRDTNKLLPHCIECCNPSEGGKAPKETCIWASHLDGWREIISELSSLKLVENLRCLLTLSGLATCLCWLELGPSGKQMKF
jgi:hypothetical protein